MPAVHVLPKHRPALGPASFTEDAAHHHRMTLAGRTHR